MHRTSSSGVMSTMTFQSGLPSVLAYRSHTALTMAAVARWMTPFSGPTQRSWLSPTMCDQKAPRSAVNDSRVRPTTSGARASIAATHSSLPRPLVNVEPVALEAVRVIRLEDDIGRRIVGLGFIASDPSSASEVGNRMSDAMTAVMVTGTCFSVGWDEGAVSAVGPGGGQRRGGQALVD